MPRKKVKKWYDGDSGRFADGTEFRLGGEGAPEKYQFGGKKATRQAASMTGQTNGWVNWEPTGRGHYGRQIGNMSNRFGPINERLRKRGYKEKGR